MVEPVNIPDDLDAEIFTEENEQKIRTKLYLCKEKKELLDTFFRFSIPLRLSSERQLEMNPQPRRLLRWFTGTLQNEMSRMVSL